MKLTITKRINERKSDAKKIRRTGDVPAILYAGSEKGETLIVSGPELEAVLRNIKPGRLPTMVFTLSYEGKETRAIIKDIQYEPTSYRIRHVDFQKLDEAVPVTVKVPIECVGMDDSPGIKLGGFLRQVIRHVPVKCLPKDIPEYLEVSVAGLGMRQVQRLSDLVLSPTVTPLAKLQEVVVVIAKR